MHFLGFPTMKIELQGKKFWSYQWSAAYFQEVHHLTREILQRRDHHGISTKFWLRVIR
jgi:hypothetical protein